MKDGGTTLQHYATKLLYQDPTVVFSTHPSWVLILMVPKRALFNARLGVNLVQTRLQSRDWPPNRHLGLLFAEYKVTLPARPSTDPKYICWMPGIGC
jgi:hypothetical protein